MLTRRTDCRLCHETKLELALSLEPSALANEFVKDPTIKQQAFPLDLFQCYSCGHYQLLDVIDPEVLFKHYNYVSSTSDLMRQHFRNYACSIATEYNFSEEDLVVDIGSNDACLLKWFQKLGAKVLGVDPAQNLAEKATSEGIPTINNFFNREVAKGIIEKQGKASIITANNVFAHSDNLDEIVLGIKELLKDDGVFIFECSYFMDVLKCGDFSQIYAEHVSYHTISPLWLFFKNHGMTLFKIEKQDIHGGSIRCFVSNKYDERLIDDALCFTDRENKAGIYNKKYDWSLTNKFVKKINEIKTELKKRLLQLKAEGKSIAAVTASAKSTTFLHQCGLGPEIIDYICDDAKDKIGAFSPGLHIPVVPFSTIYEKSPDYLLILSFNFIDSIIQKHKEYKGKWIITIPDYKEI